VRNDPGRGALGEVSGSRTPKGGQNTACHIFNHTLIPSPVDRGLIKPLTRRIGGGSHGTRTPLLNGMVPSVIDYSNNVSNTGLGSSANGNITSICPAIKGVPTLAIPPAWGSIRTVTTIATRKQTFSRFRTLAPVITEPSSKTEATAVNRPKDSNGTTWRRISMNHGNGGRTDASSSVQAWQSPPCPYHI